MATARALARTPRTSTRRRRTSPRQGPRAPTALVDRMVVEAGLVVAAYVDRLMRALEPLLRERFGQQRSDAAVVRLDETTLSEVFERVQEGHVSRGFLERMFRLTDQQAANDLSRAVPEISPEQTLRGATRMQAEWVERNTELIRMEARARQEVRSVIEGPLREGIRVEEVRARVEERLGVVRSRAELIARDQTLKLYGQIQEARQTEAGIEEYTWSTSQDERVRSRHQELEGTTQRWDTPPVVDRKTGRRGHPGDDFQCRCSAIPILPTGELPDEPPSSRRRPSLPPAPAVELEVALPANDVPAPPRLPALPPANDVPTPARAAAPPAPPPPPPPAPPPAPPAPPPPPAPPAPPPSPPPPPPPSEPPSGPPPSQRPIETVQQLNAALARRGALSEVDEGQMRVVQSVFQRSIAPRDIDAFTGGRVFAALGQQRSTISAGAGAVTFGSRAGTGVHAAAIKRTFVRRGAELVARHDSIELGTALVQGGLGPRVIVEQLTAYERQGIDRIELEAQRTGRYYWLKVGFDVPEEERGQYVRSFARWLARRGIEPLIVAELVSGIRTLQELASTTMGATQLGKEFLLGDAYTTIPNLALRIRPGDPHYERAKRILKASRPVNERKQDEGDGDQMVDIADALIGDDPEPEDGWRAFDEQGRRIPRTPPAPETPSES